MGLQKAVISQIKNQVKKRLMEVQFNPANYSLNRRANYEENIAPGKGAKDGNVQYTGNEFYEIAMELIFDTSIQKDDVRKWVKQLLIFIEKSKDQQDAFDFNFSWGTFSFTGVVSSIQTQYTMFHSDGTPLRAKLSLQAEGVVDDGTIYQTKEEVSSRKISTLNGMNQLWNLAYIEYNDASRWIEIASLNKIANPRKIQNINDLQLR